MDILVQVISRRCVFITGCSGHGMAGSSITCDDAPLHNQLEINMFAKSLGLTATVHLIFFTFFNEQMSSEGT